MNRNTDTIHHTDPPQRSAFLSLLVVSLGLIGGCKGKTEKSEQVKGEVPKTPGQVALRVSTDDLKDLLAADNVRILDVRGEADYEQGHVPGAVRVDAAAWKAQALKDDGQGLSDKAAWEKLIRQLGVGELTQVVVYSDNLPSAARIWWTLKYLGVERAGILDGGWKHWVATGGKTSTAIPEVKAGDFTIDAFDTGRLIHIDELKKALKDLQVVDARSDSEVKAGKVPGAVHLDWKQLTNEDDGTVKSANELQALFASRQLKPGKPAVTYCQSGGRAAAEAYALELAGFKDVKNYYCSWQQWGSDKTAPIEK